MSQIHTSTPTFPPIEGRDHNKLLGGLSHGTERFSGVQVSDFSDGELLRKGWDGTIKGSGAVDTFSQNKAVDHGKLSYSFSLVYQGFDGLNDVWDITDAELRADLPGQPTVLFTTQFRQDFGQVKADRHSDVVNPALDQPFTLSAVFDTDEYLSTDGGSTFNPTGAQYHFELQTVPEPSTAFLAVPAICLFLRRRR